MTRNPNRINRVKQISTCWCRESFGFEHATCFKSGDMSQNSIGKGSQEARVECEATKKQFQNAGVEKFLSLFGQSLCVVTPFAQLLEKTV